MITSSIFERTTCPHCSGPLVRVVKGEDPGMHLEFTACGGSCQKEFMPPWVEHQWSEPESRPIPTELTVEAEDDESKQHHTVIVGIAA